MTGRNSRIASLSRLGCTRLLSKITWRSRSRSSQTEVPVKPRCPTELRRELCPRARPARRRRVPTERPRRLRHAAVARPELAHERLRHQRVDAVVAVLQATEQRVEILGRGEQPGVTGDAAHRVGVVVVHLAAQHLLAPRAALGRRDHLGHRFDAPRAQQGEVDESGAAQAERPEDALVAEAVERHAADFLDRRRRAA